MKKTFILVAICISTFVFIGSIQAKNSTNLSLEPQICKEGEICPPVDDLIIKPPEVVKAKKNPVLFSHVIHEDVSCTDCHHTSTEENLIKGNLKGCMSEGCHDLFIAKETKDRRSIKNYQNAYHESCYKGCHRTKKKEGLKAGPTGCNDCHTK
jgi:hypothetical protein